MPTSPVLASYSDLAYGTALVLYLLAMVLHFIEYAAARIPATAPAAAVATAGDGSVATLASSATTRCGGAAAAGWFCLAARRGADVFGRHGALRAS
jgi:hypothetical protein